MEATTESISQFTLGNVIVRIFGISDDPTSKALQYFSLATSTLSLLMAFVTVSDLETLVITQQRSKFVFLSASNVSQTNENCYLRKDPRWVISLAFVKIRLSPLSTLYWLTDTFLHYLFCKTSMIIRIHIQFLMFYFSDVFLIHKLITEIF